jgi:uncharacterized membrane protein SirB2
MPNHKIRGICAPTHPLLIASVKNSDSKKPVKKPIIPDMVLVSTLKLIHVSCAFLSIGGFALRGYWMLTGNPLLRRRMAKTLPHIVDTTLLGSAIAMLWIWELSPLQIDWLSAKLLGLLLYIALGMVALRFGKTRRQKVGAWLLALLCAGYIISVAYSKTPWPFF